MISVSKSPDYEKVQMIVATVVATDGGTPALSATSLLNVTITDINDNSPIFSMDAYSTSVREDEQPGRSVIQVYFISYLFILYIFYNA